MAKAKLFRLAQKALPIGKTKVYKATKRPLMERFKSAGRILKRGHEKRKFNNQVKQFRKIRKFYKRATGHEPNYQQAVQIAKLLKIRNRIFLGAVGAGTGIRTYQVRKEYNRLKKQGHKLDSKKITKLHLKREAKIVGLTGLGWLGLNKLQGL